MDSLTGKDRNHRRQGVVERLRLLVANISWLMAALSEYVVRRANREDECSRRFFEGRFSCREIGDEGARLVCGLYVYLNPIRAGEVRTPEAALHTSALFRIRTRSVALSGMSCSKPSASFLVAFLAGPDR